MNATPLEIALIAAVVSFLLSGLFVSLFKDWLDRARNQVLIQSLELAPSGAVIAIPKDLVAISERSGWMHSLRNAETYQALSKAVKRAKAIGAHLEVAQILVEEWLAKAETCSGNSFPEKLFQSCPYFLDEVVGLMILGAVRRGEVGAPPLQRELLGSMESRSDLSWDSERRSLTLDLGTKVVKFPVERWAKEQDIKAVEHLAHSFAARSVPNMMFYMRAFAHAARRDALDITDIVSRIEELLLPASRLCIKASLVNTGAKAAVFRPFASARLCGLPDGDIREVLSLSELSKQRAETPTANEVLRGLRNETDGEESQASISIGDFVPSDRQSYVLVPPKTMLDVVLLSTEPLGNRGHRLRALYASEVVQCSVSVVALSGHRVESSLVPFARTLSDPERKRLLEA